MAIGSVRNTISTPDFGVRNTTIVSETPTLGDNSIGDAGIAVFATAVGSGALPQLEQLRITNPSQQLRNHCSSKSIKLHTCLSSVKNLRFDHNCTDTT